MKGNKVRAYIEADDILLDGESTNNNGANRVRIPFWFGEFASFVHPEPYSLTPGLLKNNKAQKGGKAKDEQATTD